MFDLKNNRHLTLNRKVTDLIVIDDDNEEDEKNSLDSKGSILNGQQSATTSSSGNVSTNSFASLPAHMSLSTKQLTKLVADAPNWTKIKDEMERRKIQLHQEVGLSTFISLPFKIFFLTILFQYLNSLKQNISKY